MNQEKVGKFIKELRIKNNLSQKEFADKLNVTFQAVSKWENGKNLPDIEILYDISRIFNIDINDILNVKTKNKKNNKKIIIMIIIFMIVIITTLFLFLNNNKNDDFIHNEIKTNVIDFDVSGSIAHTKDRSSLIIYINYKGNDNNTYNEIKTSLYEQKGNIINKLISGDIKNNITINDYLKDYRFKLDHKENNCGLYNNSNMYIELSLKYDGGFENIYKIPLEIVKENCD